MERIEKNKLVAIFMGYTYYPYMDSSSSEFMAGWKINPDISQFSKFNDASLVKPYLTRSHNGLIYHESYDWLMPVVHRINSFIGTEVSIFKTYNSISVKTSNKNKIDYRFADSTIIDVLNPISSLFELVVKYVMWYNLDKQ